jgi:hypothetical protein
MSAQIQNLSDQFNSLLTQYTDTYQSYINVITTNDNSLTTVIDSSFVGKGNINVLDNSSIDACKSSCASNTSCSGATFNNTTNSCTLSNGNGNIVPTQKSTAIVQQALKYSYQLQQINSQLMDINKKIMTITQTNYNQFAQKQEKVQSHEQLIHNNYNTLTQERDEIARMIQQYETINAAYEDSTINTNSNYYSYILLFFIALFLLFLFVKFNIQSEQNGGKSGINARTKFRSKH